VNRFGKVVGDTVQRGAIASRVAVGITSALVALLAAEAALRLLTPAQLGQRPFPGSYYWMAEDPVLGFANRPLYRHSEFAINERGFRGPPIRSDVPPSTRIVCLGDSGTFGIWLEVAGEEAESQRIRYDNYPEELGRVLAERGYRAEVVNAGVVG